MPRLRATPLLALGLVLALASTAAAATDRSVSSSALGSQARATAKQTLRALTIKTGPTDTQWYANGVWHSPGPSCWFCADGPGTLAATLWRVDGRRETVLFKEAVETFDRTIAAQQNPDGSFGDETLPNTQFFGVELGTTYLLLGDRLGPRHQAAWRKTIAGAASYLIRHGDVTWESNGNINLGNTELEWLAWAITGQQRFHHAYELAWRYALHPPQGRWPGYGLHVTRGSGASAAGYLAENGGNGPGFDPEYTMLQLSVASRSYLLSHDPRFLTLANMLWNQLDPLVKRPVWHLDALDGTRRSHVLPLTSPGIAVLGTDGGDDDLLRLVHAQTTTAMYPTYLMNARQNWGNPGVTRGYGNEFAVALLALASPPTLAQGTVSAVSTGERASKRPAEPLRATVTASGVHLSWTSTGSQAHPGRRVDVLVDGRLTRTVRGTQLFLPLAAGLYQIAIVQSGRAMRASTTITVPAA